MSAISRTRKSGNVCLAVEHTVRSVVLVSYSVQRGTNKNLAKARIAKRHDKHAAFRGRDAGKFRSAVPYTAPARNR
jgi:hypothetical protein